MALSITVFLTTFLFEDIALGLALAFIAQNKITFMDGFLACSLGIAVGDLGLYYIGRLASRISYFEKKIRSPQLRTLVSELSQTNKMAYAIVISRMLPGTRLPTYLAAGLINYSILKFFLLTLLSVGLWVFVALSIGATFLSFFADHWLLALIGFILILTLVQKGLLLMKDPWHRKASYHAWRRWLHFEFWPAWFFYLPIVPYYLLLSLRHRSLLLPFYANPNLKHGGLIGESKWDFLQHLNSMAQTTLPAVKISKKQTVHEIHSMLGKKSIDYPFIAKPDIGQRGFGVRIIKSEAEFVDYLDASEEDVIIQRKSQYPCEAGVFYIKIPQGGKSFIFSITDKKFPAVQGDGVTQLGDLILQDSRARIIAATYFQRHRESLEKVLSKNEIYPLSECGNHCQGAIFLNGVSLASPKLLAAIEEVVEKIPNFYFGRIDLRYQDPQSLTEGQSFEIVEINGAGSEATHIWDSRTTIYEAYRVLFNQWSLLFLIGAEIKSQGNAPRPQIFQFLIDCAKVYFRKNPLSISS